MCPLMLQKLVLSIPFFHGWQGSWGSRSKNLLEGVMKQMLVQGQPEAPGRSLGFGHQQHPKSENRDSQNMLNQLEIRKRGRRNGVASDFSRFLPFFPFSSVFPFPFFSLFVGFLGSVFFPFFPVFFRFLLFSSSQKEGETPFARPLQRNPESAHAESFPEIKAPKKPTEKSPLKFSLKSV